MLSHYRSLIFAFLLLGLSSLSTAQPNPAEEDNKIVADSWTRYVRGFRKSHHFSMTGGIAQNKWDFSGFDSGAGAEETNSLILKLRYSFHIPWRGRLGFFLGTSMGARVESKDDKHVHKSNAGYQYPGLWAGMIFNIDSKKRLWLSYERFLERNDPIEIRTPTLDTKIGTTMTGQDVSLGFDYFFDLRWAISFEFHYDYFKHYEPKSSESKTNPLNIEFSRQGYWAGVGVIFHHL